MSMQELFPEFYLGPIDLDELWEEAVFVFDTNVLLNLYRYPKVEREDFLQALEQIIDRLWLPSYVVYEYQRRRIGKIQDQYDAYERTRKDIVGMKKEISDYIESYRHPDTDLNIQGRLKKICASLQTIIDDIQKQKHAKPDLITAETDAILDWLDKTYVGDRLSERYSDKKIAKLTEKWRQRKEQNIPPGCNDERPGDFIIWKQIIKYAKSQQKSIIFVTDDEGWIENGKPLTELCREMYREAGVHCWIYGSDHFTAEGKRRDYLAVTEETIEVAADVVRHAEAELTANLTTINPMGNLGSESPFMRPNLGIARDIERLNAGLTIPREYMQLSREFEGLLTTRKALQRALEPLSRSMDNLSQIVRMYYKSLSWLPEDVMLELHALESLDTYRDKEDNEDDLHHSDDDDSSTQSESE